MCNRLPSTCLRIGCLLSAHEIIASAAEGTNVHLRRRRKLIYESLASIPETFHLALLSVAVRAGQRALLLSSNVRERARHCHETANELYVVTSARPASSDEVDES